jgi:regulator of replication initiation timing
MDEQKIAEVRENEALRARLRDLETENKRLRIELDWMREKLSEVEAKLRSDHSAEAS